MNQTRVILDCDPGIDDAISILTALASPDELEVLAITTSAGNVGLDQTTRNACALRSLAGRNDVPVYAGADRPLVRALQEARHVHGATGLGPDTQIPEGAPADDLPAVEYLVRTLCDAAPSSITLVPTGPLTNIAAALQRAPDIAQAIDQIVLMGGAYREGGNITASAEFNIFTDPDAARVVLECGRPVTMIGLDATYQFRITPDRMAALKAMDHPVTDLFHRMMTHINAVYGELYGAEGAALHDPCTTCFLLAPDLFQTVDARIDVETDSDLTRGHTAVDMHDRTDKPANARWVTQLDGDGLFDLITERLRRL